MTLTKFDSRHIDRYNEPRFLVHFQWGTNEKFIVMLWLRRLIQMKLIIPQNKNKMN